MSSRNNTRNRLRAALILAAGSATVGLIDKAHGTGGTWTFSGNDNWSSTGAWLGGAVANGIDEVAGFGVGSGNNVLDTLTVTLDTNRTIGSLNFGDSDGANTPAGWVLKPLSSQILTLSGVSAQPSITASTLGAGNGTSQIGTLFQKVANITVGLSGTQGFEKLGTGTVIISGNNAGLSGSISLTQGILVLNSSTALGSTSLLSLRTGQMAFRGDSSLNFSGTSIVLQNDTTIGTGNTITAGAQYGTGANLSHTLGNITIDTYGVRTVGVSGSNGYGLAMGRLTLRDGINLINQGNSGSINGAGSNNNVNGQGSGLVTIGTITYAGPGAGTINLDGVGAFAGDFTVTNGITNTGGGSAALVYSGSKTLTLNGAIGTNGDTYVTGGTTGSVAALTYEAGVGTMIANVGALPSGKAVTINGGTLLLNAATTHTIGGLTMGGATLTTGPVPAFLGTGAGTAALAGNIVVNDSILFDTGTTTGSAVATAGSLTGRLDLGGSTRGIAVNGSSTLTVGAVVNGSGGITKTGTGALNLTNINTFTGAINIVDGVVSGTAAAAGNSLGSTGANVSLGGALRVNGLVGVGTATVNTLTSKDSGGNEGLIVDATLGGTTTLTINSYGGRELGTHGTIKVVPVTGQLNTKEIVRLATGAPLPTNGMLPAYFAVQNSGTNSQLNFASATSNQIVAFNGYSSGTVNINTTGASTVYSQTATENLTGAKQLFGLKIGANASLTGATALTLGNGTTGFGGLIMNGGVLVNNGSITTLGTDELVFWSGGTNPNTVASSIFFNGDLTTGGSQVIDLAGAMNFNGSARNVTVTGGTALLSSASALSGSTGFNKRGGGVLAVNNSNLTFNGTIGIQGGTVQIGTGVLGDIGTASVTNNANIAFRRTDSSTFSNAISGTGDLWMDGTSSGILTLAGPLTYTGKTTVTSGTLRINTADRLPTGTALRIEGGATFDLTGFGQNVSTLAGTGTVTNSGLTPQIIATSSGTFSGAFRNGASGSVSLVKNGGGLLVLDGSGSSFSGPVTVNGGTLEIDNGSALGIPVITGGTANGTITLNNSALVLNNTATRTIQRPFAFTGVSTIVVTANPNPQVGPVLDNVGVAISGANSNGANAASNTGGWSGGGTLVLDLRGRQLDIGANNIANPGNGNGGNNVAATFQNFTGTLMFSDNNPVGSWTRWPGGVNGFATGNPAATFAFGSGYNNFSFRNGTVQFYMGFVSGGTNTVLMACENADNRTVVYNIGDLPGQQTFFGAIRDYDRQNGAFALSGLDKEGSFSSLTLRGIHDYTRPTNVNAGSLIMGPGGNIRGSTTISINNGTLAMNGGTFGGTFGGSGQFINITAAGTNTIGGALDVTAVPGYSTPPSVTYIGGGTVYGSVNHNVGTLNPGSVGGFGTLTFANNLTVANSNLSFDVVSGLTNNLGATLGGTSDVLDLPAVNALSLNGGIVRLNFTGTGSTGLSAGQYYPVIKFNGAVGGVGPSSMLAIALFKGSFLMVQGTGSLANTLGVQVVTPTAPASSITWKPTVADPTDTWDIGGAQNWVPNGGGPQTFYFNQEGITFNDTTTHRNVNLAPTFLGPQFLTVTTNNEYLFSGAGTITGSTGLVKNGTGTLTVQTRNNYTGGTTVNGGFIIQDLLTAGLAFGPGTIALNGNSGFAFTAPSPNANFGPTAGILVVNGNNTLGIPQNSRAQDVFLDIIGSGTLTVTQPEHVGGSGGGPFMRGSMSSFAGTILFAPRLDALKFQLSDEAAGSATGNFGSASAIFDMGNSNSTFSLGTAGRTYDLGGLKGDSGFVTGNEYNNTATWTSVSASNTATISVGGANKDTTFGGQIVNANGNNQTHLVKVGNSGTLTLTNLQTYTGNTLVNGGTLALVVDSSSPLASPTIIVGTNGVLDISGVNGGLGLVLNGDQRLISNGAVVGASVEAVSTSTVGGTQFGIPLIVDDGGTISPGASAGSVGSLTVTQLTMGAAEFLIEADLSGIDSLVLAGTQEEPILQSNPAINIVNLGGFVPGTYTFLEYDGDPAIQSGIETGFVVRDSAYTVTLIHDCANTRVLMNFVNNTAQWFVNSNGTWSTASNWTQDGTNPSAIVPNAVTFGTFINAPRTVNVNGVLGNTANTIIFDSPQSYTIAGPGTLTLDGGGSVPVTVLQGNHAITAPVRALKTVGLSVNTGLTFSFGGTINGQNNSGITKIGSGTASFTRLNMPGGTLVVGAGKVRMTTKPTNNSVDGTNLMGALTISAGATVDLTNNAMILDSASNATVGAQLVVLRAELADGRLFSSAVASNTTLGYRSNNTGTGAAAGTTTAGQGLGSVATFAGLGVDNTSVLIRITYKGDSNLDGVVNVLDLVNLALNWQSTNGVWAGGDFNYDGLVNSSDLAILATGWQLGNNNPLPGDDIGAALTAAGVPLSAVPEPGTLGLAGLGAVSLLARRRRRA